VRIREKFESGGLALIGPTRRDGYLDEHCREPATRREKMRHIQEVLNRDYSLLSGMPIRISERNLDIYGVSTTPTLVPIDRTGKVSLYHPGRMP
jgi:thioredoxin-related protein